MASSEEVFELVENISTRLHQLQTVLSLAHDASDAGLTTEEVVLRSRITKAREHFAEETLEIHEGRFSRFLHRNNTFEAQDLAKLERDLEAVQSRRPNAFDYQVYENPEREQIEARQASHAARPFRLAAVDNRKHYAQLLEDARQILSDCATLTLRINQIADEVNDEGPDATEIAEELIDMTVDYGRRALVDLDDLYKDLEADFVVAAAYLGYDLLGSHAEIANTTFGETVSQVDIIRFGLRKADDANQSLVYAALKPIKTEAEPTPILIVLDLDTTNEQDPLIVGRRGLAWGESAIYLNAPKVRIPLERLMTDKTEFDNESVSFGVPQYGGIALSVPGLAARVAEGSTGMLENAPGYKHLASRYFTHLRNVASGNAHEDGVELSTLSDEQFGDRILDAHVQLEATKDTLINEGPQFGL